MPTMPPPIMNANDVMKVFKVGKSTLKKNYRDWPHFHVTSGQDLRSARFVYSDMLDYFKSQEAAYGAMARQGNRQVDIQIRSRIKTLQKTGLPDKGVGPRLGIVQTGRTKNGRVVDPFSVFGGDSD